MFKEEKIRILCVDDETNFLSLQKKLLQINEGFEVETSNSVIKAFQLLDNKSFDIIVSDYQMPETDGLQFIESLRKKRNFIPFILLTGKGREEVVIKALNLGVTRYIQKGSDTEAMLAELTDAINKIVTNNRNETIYYKSLENAANEWKNTFDSITDIATVISPSHTILKANKTLLNIVGLSEEQVIGKKCYTVVHGTSKPIPECPCNKSLKTKSFETSEIEMNNILFRANCYPVIKNDKIVSFTHTIKDISKQKKIEQLLKYSEEKYRDIVENSQDMIFQCDLKGNQIFINDTWAKEHGYKVEDMQDKPFQDFVEPEALKRDMVVFKKILEGGSVKNHYTTHLTKNGDPIHLIFNAQPLYNQAKQIIGTQGSATNITKNVKLEKQLIEHEKKYLNLFNSSNDMICVYSMDRKILDVNEKICNTLGYSKNELIGMKIEQLITNKTKKVSDDRINKLFEGKKIGINENILVTKTGKQIPVEVNSNLVNNIYGEKKVIQSYLRDINEKKKYEQKMLEIEDKYQVIVETSPNFIYILQDNKIVFANSTVINRLGWKREELMSPDFNYMEKIFPKQYLALMRKNNKKRLQEEIFSSYKIEILSKNKERIPVSVFAKKIFFNNKNALLYVLIDLSEISKIEEEKISSIKNIVRNISHDIRNPLSVISGSNYLLKDISDKKIQKMYPRVENAVNSINILLEGLIDFEKEINLDIEKCDIINVIENSLSGLFISNNIKINLIKIDLPLINLDKEKMNRVFSNLFLNSIQAMPKGGKLDIVVKKKIKFLEIEIKDTGIGISKNNMRNLFIPFFTTKKDGSGIGLNNVKNIIESHKGTINIESTEGKGTTITLKLPLT